MPVTGKAPDDVDARAIYFKHRIEVMVAASAFDSIDFQYDPNIHVVLAECYFALSEAYKRVRLNAGARTEHTKVSAITAATISYVQPLRRLDPKNEAKIEATYANPMMAMRSACLIVDFDFDFDQYAFDDRMRIYRHLRSLTFSSLGPILSDAHKNNGTIVNEYEIFLSEPELGRLDGLISMFGFMHKFAKREK